MENSVVLPGGEAYACKPKVQAKIPDRDSTCRQIMQRLFAGLCAVGRKDAACRCNPFVGLSLFSKNFCLKEKIHES